MNEDFDLTLDIELEGDWRALRRRLHSATLTGARVRRTILHQWLRHLASFATAEQHRIAPTGDSGYLQAHIHQSDMSFRPGGFGGGGTYVITTGVLRGTSLHPLYVHEGTKNIYGSFSVGAQNLLARGLALGEGFGPPLLAQGRIYPRNDRAAASVIATRRPRARANFLTAADDFMTVSRRPALTFQKRGEPRKWRAWVTGQRPQPFVYHSFRHTVVYAKGQLRAIARNLI